MDSQSQSQPQDERRPTAEELAIVVHVCSIGPDAHYDVLGVPAHATPRELRHAFIAIVKQVHPDHNLAPCATEATKLVQAAWEVLGDPDRRSAYDQQRNRPAYDFRPPGETHWQNLTREFEDLQARRQTQAEAVLRAWQEAQERRQMRNEMLGLLYAYMLHDGQFYIVRTE